MTNRKDQLKSYINGLLSKAESVVWKKGSDIAILDDSVVGNPIIASESLCQELYTSTVSLLQKLYGENSHQANTLYGRHDALLVPDDNRYFAVDVVIPICHGKLKGILNDIENDLIYNLESQVSAEIFSDFILSASQALEAGQKDIAAVIASAALEDILKKIGQLNGLDVKTKEIEKVKNMLTGKNLLKGSSEKLVEKYIFIRNKALHAEWDKFQAEEIGSMIGFLEGLITKHFTGS